MEIFSARVAVPYSIGSSASRRLRLRVCSRPSLLMALWRRKTTQAVMTLPSTEYRLYQRFLYVIFLPLILFHAR